MFDLAVCAEMVFLDLPFEQRVRRIAESGFQVEIWNWTRHDVDALVATGARFSSMVGHTAGSLLDEDGANALLQGAEESLAVAERLGCARLVVFGTELGPDGVPLRPVHKVTGPMWVNAYRTLDRLAELRKRANPFIGEVQVADVPGRCEPGTGEINYPAIAAALREMGYRGTVGLEAYASGDSEVALERFTAVFGADASAQQQPQ